jgi:hypothetical protein
MFIIAQLFKILLVVAFIYMLYNLIVYFIRIGKIVHAKRKEAEMRREGSHDRQAGGRAEKQVIKLDKDQYKVE